MKYLKYLSFAIPALEWYDFAICTNFVYVLSSNFSPDTNPTIQIIYYFASFAFSYIGRPLGAFLFGWYSDKNSRIKAAFYALLIMSLSSFFISILPTYSSFGVYSTFFFVLLRFIQGLAIGGNYGSSIFSIESVPEKQKYFYSSLISLGAIFGFFAGAFVSYFFYYFFSEYFIKNFGWRIALIQGVLLALPILFYLFINFSNEKSLKKTSLPKNCEKNEKQSKFSFITFFQVISLSALDMIPFYLFYIFLPTYKIMQLGYDSAQVSFYNSLSLGLIFFTIPFFGYLCDKTGPFVLLIFSNITLILCSFFFPWENTAWSFVFPLIMGSVYGSLYGLIAFMFNKSYRARASGLALNIASVIFGGFCPLISSVYINYVAFFIFMIFSLTLFVLFYIKKNNNKEIFRKIIQK